MLTFWRWSFLKCTEIWERMRTNWKLIFNNNFIEKYKFSAFKCRVDHYSSTKTHGERLFGIILKITNFEEISWFCENQQILQFSALFCIVCIIFFNKVFRTNISKQSFSMSFGRGIMIDTAFESWKLILFDKIIFEYQLSICPHSFSYFCILEET